MKEPKPGTVHYFVDEPGDPTFYGRGRRVRIGTEGCSPILALGFAECGDPRPIRARLRQLREQIAGDPYFSGIPSVAKTGRAFHAKDDCSEVRMLVFRALAELDFRAQVVVGRKILRMFDRKFHGRPHAFYDDLVGKLFENILHRNARNVVCFSARSSRKRQEPYLQAIRRGVQRFEAKWAKSVATQIDVIVQRPEEEPCLQVIDYALWAVQRAYIKREMRFFGSIREEFSLVADPCDRNNYPDVYFDRERNPFHIHKTSPL